MAPIYTPEEVTDFLVNELGILKTLLKLWKSVISEKMDMLTLKEKVNDIWNSDNHEKKLNRFVAFGLGYGLSNERVTLLASSRFLISVMTSRFKTLLQQSGDIYGYPNDTALHRLEDNIRSYNVLIRKLCIIYPCSSQFLSKCLDATF